MINFTLYKYGLKSTGKIMLVIGAVLVMYFAVIVTMFDPKMGEALNEIAEVMPEMMAMFGMGLAPATLTDFMTSYLYGLLMPVLPMVFSILAANKLVAKLVDSGSMTSLLASPVRRSAVAFTQMKVLATGIFALVLVGTITGIASAEHYFPGQLDIGSYLVLNMGALCLHVFIGGLCFFSSCFFNSAGMSTGFGAGIPTLMYIVQMLANMGGKLENVKYATFFTLFNPDGLIAGEASAYAGAAILFAGGLALFAAAIAVFSKKDLHI